MLPEEIVRPFWRIPEVSKINTGMEIKLNNQATIFPDQCSVQQLLDLVMPEKQKGIAIAVNSMVIPKINWQNHFIKPNDAVLIIKAAQGG